MPKIIKKPAQSNVAANPAKPASDPKPTIKAEASGIPVYCDHTRLVDVADMKPNPRNPNKHSDTQVALLAKNIRHLGWRHPITVSIRSGFIVAGHGRLQSANLLKVEKVPVDFQYFATDAEEYAVLIADNRIAELAEPDKNLLKDLMSDLDGIMGLKDPELCGYTKEEWEDLMSTGKPPTPEHLDDTPAPALKALTKPGDLWMIKGKNGHRLFCGDSTKPEDLARVLCGVKATIIWTDPPWNVAYGKTKHPSWKQREIKNDNLGDEFLPFCQAFIGQMKANAAPGAPMYMAMSAQEWPLIDRVLREAGFHWSSTIIWAKDSLVLSRKDYHTQYEPIWYGWLEGAPRMVEVVDRKQSDLWAIPRPKKSEEHPTMKPVALVVQALVNSSRADGMVLDCFGGSGTTMIASEHVGRQSCSIELDPIYCDVIVKRFLKAYPGSKAFCNEKEVEIGDFPKTA